MAPCRVRALLHRPRTVLRDLERAVRRRWNSSRRHRIGWVTAHTLEAGAWPERLGRLGASLDMRVSRTAEWINVHTTDVWNEIYDPRERYDVVVFVKAMGPDCRAAARRIRGYGGKVVFDANVNYYEIWGEYDVPGTRPTEEQRAAAIEMTALADWVVADSQYLLSVLREYAEHVTWIPDNVNLSLFQGLREHRDSGPLTLVWGGMSHKAQHLLSIRGTLARLSACELVVVSERVPPFWSELQSLLPCRFVPYDDARYARTLRGCDVIISPKRLTNAYEMGHTEYKITLGMAVGLPAVASRQPSYVDAISHAGGGILADTQDEWLEAFERLSTRAELRAEMGRRAHRTVVERYSTEVVCAQYEQVIRGLLR